MPLFGSQKSRNKRLFDRWIYAVLKLIERLPWEPEQKAIESIWWVTGSAAANVAVDSFPTIGKCLGKRERRESRIPLSRFYLADGAALLEVDAWDVRLV